jgi:hypothetical protein
VDGAGTLLPVAGEDTLSSSSNMAAESLYGAGGWGGNFANGRTDRQGSAAYCSTRKNPVGIVISHNRQQTWGWRIILQMELC